MQPIQINVFAREGMKIDSGPYTGHVFGRLVMREDGAWEVYSFDGVLDFITNDQDAALHWAVGNAYRFVAHKMKNG